jgi:hypothetical protein
MFLNWRSGSLGPASPLHHTIPSTEEALMRETCNTSGVSRRTVLLAAAGAAPLLALTGGQAQAKIAQTAVHYQTTPKDGKQCDGCNFFMAPNGCKLVDGEIAATGWCALWAKKASA